LTSVLTDYLVKHIWCFCWYPTSEHMWSLMNRFRVLPIIKRGSLVILKLKHLSKSINPIDKIWHLLKFDSPVFETFFKILDQNYRTKCCIEELAYTVGNYHDMFSCLESLEKPSNTWRHFHWKMKDTGQTSSKNGFWDVKIRFLQNAFKCFQMMWDVFGGVPQVPRHVIHDIRPYENDSKKFFENNKIQHQKPVLPHLLVWSFEEAHFPSFWSHFKT